MSAATVTRKQNQEAYREAVKALNKEKVDEVKALIKQALEEMHKAERQRQEAVEKIQLVKRDIEDLRMGRIEKIKERHGAVKKADQWSPFTDDKLQKIFSGAHQLANLGGFATTSTAYSLGAQNMTATALNTAQLQNAVAGTYTLDDGTVKHIG